MGNMICSIQDRWMNYLSEFLVGSKDSVPIQQYSFTIVLTFGHGFYSVSIQKCQRVFYCYGPYMNTLFMFTTNINETQGTEKIEIDSNLTLNHQLSQDFPYFSFMGIMII